MPSVIDYKLKYASFLFSNNKIKEAQKQYLSALSLNPSVKEIYASLGLIYILQDDYENAELSLKKAISMDPDYILPYENLVLLSQKRGDIKLAKLYLYKILDIDPDHQARKVLQAL